MKGGKIVRQAPSDRKGLIACIVESTFPLFSMAYYKIEETEPEPGPSQTYEQAVESAMIRLANLPWDEGLGLTQGEHRDLQDGLQLREELADKSDAELKFRYNEVVTEREAQKFDQEDADRWAYFNETKATADFCWWAKLASWTVDEATALSLGKDPRIVNTKTLQSLNSQSKFAREYLRLRDLFQRASSASIIGDPIDPQRLIAHCDQVGIEVPDKLREALSRSEAESLPQQLSRTQDKLHSAERAISKLKAENKNKGASRKELNTLLKIVFGLAVHKYHYNSSSLKSSAPGHMSSALAQEGIEVSDETIRKHLKAAALLIGPADSVDEASRGSTPKAKSP